jgi:predicted transcriptional regulator
MIEIRLKEMQQLETISKAIRKKMEERGISIRSMSDEVSGLSRSQIARVLDGKNYTIQTLMKILIFLDLEVHLKHIF